MHQAFSVKTDVNSRWSSWEMDLFAFMFFMFSLPSGETSPQSPKKKGFESVWVWKFGSWQRDGIRISRKSQATNASDCCCSCSNQTPASSHANHPSRLSKQSTNVNNKFTTFYNRVCEAAGKPSAGRIRWRSRCRLRRRDFRDASSPTFLLSWSNDLRTLVIYYIICDSIIWILCESYAYLHIILSESELVVLVVDRCR